MRCVIRRLETTVIITLFSSWCACWERPHVHSILSTLTGTHHTQTTCNIPLTPHTLPSHTQAHKHSRKIHFPWESWLGHAPACSEPRVPAPPATGGPLFFPHHPPLTTQQEKAYNSPTICCLFIMVLSPRCSDLNTISLSQISWKPLLRCSTLSAHRFIWGRNAELSVLIHPIYGLFILVHFLTVFANFSAPFVGYKSLSWIRDFPLVINDARPKLHVPFLWFVYRDIIGFCLLIYILHSWEFAHYLFNKYSLSTTTCQAFSQVLERRLWAKGSRCVLLTSQWKDSGKTNQCVHLLHSFWSFSMEAFGPLSRSLGCLQWLYKALPTVYSTCLNVLATIFRRV